MCKNEITKTQLNWIIHALQKEMGMIRDDMDHAEEGSPTWAIGEVLYGGRESLVTQLIDIEQSGYKTIRII